MTFFAILVVGLLLCLYEPFVLLLLNVLSPWLLDMVFLVWDTCVNAIAFARRHVIITLLAALFLGFLLGTASR